MRFVACSGLSCEWSFRWTTELWELIVEIRQSLCLPWRRIVSICFPNAADGLNPWQIGYAVCGIESVKTAKLTKSNSG